MVKLISEAEFEHDVIESELPVVVDFFATWCGPCKMLSPVLDRLAGELEGRARIVKIDVDQSRDTAIKYGVKSMPTLIVFKGGEVMDRFVGAMAKDELKSKVEPWI